MARTLQNQWFALLLAGILILPGCKLSAYHNEPLGSPVQTRASFNVTDTQGNDDVLVALAISGGGSRAAYFAACAMFKLQKVIEGVDLMKEVDVISSVSGGSLPAAYYCISMDELGFTARSGRLWEEATVKELMSRNFQGRWLGNNFWPGNFCRSMFTAYDHSDIMAQTLEDNLFDTKGMGLPLTFYDLNPERPYLILNATDVTADNGEEKHFGNVFTFTDEDFVSKLNSDLSTFPIAWGVMASCAFPGVFNLMTLKDFRDDSVERYMHVFDGGNSDNLGLESIKKIILHSMFWGDAPAHKHYIVILIDSYQNGQGVDPADYDPRSFMSTIFDTNVIDAFDSLLKFRRDDLINQFSTGILDVDKDKKIAVKDLTFWHLTFEDIDPTLPDQNNESLYKTVNHIPTNFHIIGEDRERIDRAVDHLIQKNNPKLIEIFQKLYR
ncbi:MAG: patatin-like phospholipase family protein [Planctomycetota bacterium]